ncbi:hypothetical protein Tco_0885171 [Tanacetum coccineum]
MLSWSVIPIGIPNLYRFCSCPRLYTRLHAQRMMCFQLRSSHCLLLFHPLRSPPGYIIEFDLEEDPEEDQEEDDKDPKEDLADYPIDKDVMMRREESSGDDADNDEEDDDEDEEEQEEAGIPEVELPPRKRLCIAPPDPRYEIGECSSAPTAREIGYGITDVWEDLDEITKEIPATGVAELASREAWVKSMDASDTAHSEAQMVALQSQQRPAGDPAHPDVSEEAGSSS